MLISQGILTFKLFNIESVTMFIKLLFLIGYDIPIVFHLCLFNNILYALEMGIRFLV